MHRVATREFDARRLPALLLGCVVVNCLIVTTVPAQSENEARRIAKVKRAVNKIGVDQRVDVKLLDGSRVKGHLTEVGDIHFVVVEKKTGDSRTLTFAQVKQVGRTLDNGFSDPRTIMGLAFIPLIIGLVFWAGRQD